jgi:hypothetical protein
MGPSNKHTAYGFPKGQETQLEGFSRLLFESYIREEVPYGRAQITLALELEHRFRR